MERNIGDQLKKAFEAYRQASIEKDSAKRELQQKTDYYQSNTQQLEQQIEDQNKLITKLKAQLSSATKLASDEASQKCQYPALQKQEVESSSSYDHHTADISCSHQMLLMSDHMAAQKPPCRLPGSSSVEKKDVLDMFWELRGNLQVIQALTRKQTDHLRKICRGNNIANEQQFSIPIQCTEVTAERAEGPLGPFSSAARPSGAEREEEEGGEPAPVSPPSSRAKPEERDFPDSLTELSVRFPPSTESEYDFLNSAVGKTVDAIAGRQELAAVTGVPMATDEQSLGVAIPIPIPHAGSASTDITHEGIRGPQQLLWSPDLCEVPVQGACADPPRGPNHRKCEFCNALVPLEDIYSHLNSHFQSPTSNGY
ncbi:hypothetical protein SKAU_G00253400 [Synaphobranchus kaupii]|uniref:Tbk1/Ikki binding domain-containing protein n=1 Tax=Synaphobranchus kaupii TaxID=118154 RepID=A0A9Q1IS32_SYNKA|nr:hypothetical protein SKAU_G00253400 [Synaphobranchus kaupii]